MTNTDEISIKTDRLTAFLDRHKLDGVWLQNRNNFAWITGGRDNHIANSTPVGVTAVFATRDRRVCFANSIEAPRMRTEELVDTDLETIDFPWYDRNAAKIVISQSLGGKRVAADTDTTGLNLQPLPDDFAELRWSLTDAEITRYRDGAARVSRAMESACREVERGMTEHEIAGLLDHHVHAQGANPTVTLIAADERICRYRHPIPTNSRLARYVMLVSCAEFGGLISCMTRFVHFGPMSDELKKKHHAICQVDAAVNLATKPGRTLGEIFTDLQKAYADHGGADQWKLHHQGGSTGYAGREVVANPSSDVKVVDNQAFAWNPSMVGVKCEDTVLCTPSGIEVLTAHSESWPTITGEFNGQSLRRADMLVR
ncbi:MAG TPA: M24 family metallopeptidase [Tepidisphaeraceae bacterium]|jgi:Xaa-Pro aminopeptidase|nr:M24 family metallopeptidase [Tepidisphaeraceae bacterium]